MEQYTNELINESSLYLQQHAHNPVNWVAWSKEAFEQAKRENKLVLVSVGYSACHWCHVMEHECFEDEEVATLMNKFFVCIKVDREERPDVDQVYMTAVQLMTQKGGWPLNCFTIPDGRPIYGGTYFPKEQWMHVLRSLNHTYENDPEKVLEYATQLTEGVKNSELIEAAKPISAFPEGKLEELVRRWQARMDQVEGGPTHAPKFPLPNNYKYLLHHGHVYQNEAVLKHVALTLHKMALGGIYDQIGGGFSRYSVDMLWKVPHFEKMLYDNGQLLELYAHAYRFDPNPEYKRVLTSTLNWLEREMTSEEGGLFAAQDADSEGEEGKYYVWNLEEIKAVLGDERASWFWELYNPQNKGYWEHNNWILLRDETFEAFLKRHTSHTENDIQTAIDDLFAERKRRIAPGTDTKCLTAWNAMTITGLCAAYRATEDESFKLMALKIGRWILSHQLTAEGKLWHSHQNGRAFIDGFLDDYAFVIEAFIELYQLTADENWLEKALQLEKTTALSFYDQKSGMYFFSPENSELITRKMELGDNVIPSTNSVMGHDLLNLFHLTDQFEFEQKAKQLLTNMLDGMEQYGSGYSNWALLLLRFQEGVACIKAPKTVNSFALQQLLSPFNLVKFEAQDFYSICADGACSPALENLEAVKRELGTSSLS
jgi:uncharacterized protein YyaL (SSP411 family)